jgi:Tfp pilus assembly protein PilN
MIQINLVPDIKQEFLKAQNNKRVVITLSMLVSGSFIAIVILLWSYVTVVQGTHTKNLDNHIAELLAQYQSPDNISKVLTVNGQLSALPALHQQKPAMTRLANYLAKLIPNDITIDNIDIDITNGTIGIKGLGKQTVSVEKFITSLKNAVYYINPGDSGEAITAQRVFNNTKLSSFGTTEEDEATFEVSTSFDSTIFNNAIDIILTIPKTTSDEVEFITPEELTQARENTPSRQGDLFEPIKTEEDSQ